MRLPSLKFLRTFQIAARHLSFKEASIELSLTASAVSHQIKNLESFLGIPLFNRKTRALELTNAGRNYYEFLDRMFAELEVETQQLRMQYERKIIRVCVPPFFASEALLPRLAEYHAISPVTDIRVSTQPSAMKDHPPETDLSVLLGKGHWPQLKTYQLFSRKVVTACSPGLLKKSGVKKFADLNGQVLIVHEMRIDAWERWAETLGIPHPRPGKLIRFDSMSAVVRAAEQGIGFALVSWPLGQHLFDSRSLERVFDVVVDTGEDFFLAHRPADAAQPEVQKITNWLLNNFRITDEKNLCAQ
jgi:DNA-binding transcriptional LysR family regulator